MNLVIGAGIIRSITPIPFAMVSPFLKAGYAGGNKQKITRGAAITKPVGILATVPGATVMSWLEAMSNPLILKCGIWEALLTGLNA